MKKISGTQVRLIRIQQSELVMLR
ncbi:protein of unknown function [Candidatus Nitrosotalea okcheonensis]|uniref:Uncharacterized protein n=1 Tax=Candidatus Nitrosotalea okcheonensis TaxID=1903276 RepID=A0A2H1FG54_9ARCH|nr:protein of unknown function [Candidatus Nitrosotalea okcheonensis]